MGAAAPAAMVVPALLALGGCVLDDIHTETVAMRDDVAEVRASLNDVETVSESMRNSFDGLRSDVSALIEGADARDRRVTAITRTARDAPPAPIGTMNPGSHREESGRMNQRRTRCGMVNTNRARRAALAATLAALPLPLTGCIVEDIYDEIVVMGDTLAAVRVSLDETNTRLDTVETQLNEVQRTNDLLVSLQAALGTGADTEEQTEAQRTISQTLGTIAASLERLDKHLGSLRSTLGNIDRTIPFLKFADEDEEEEEDGAGAGEGEDADAEDVERAPEDGAPENATDGADNPGAREAEQSDPPEAPTEPDAP